MIDWVQNIPFCCIFLAMIAGIVTPLMPNHKTVRTVSLGMITLNTVLSFLLLMAFTRGKPTFTFMMGHFPAPWGNELRAGPLEALMAFTFCIVMLLSLVGNKKDLIFDIQSHKVTQYYVMINLLLSSLMALVYTNDLFTAYVFIEINTIAACGIVMVKDSGETLFATLRYLIMSLLGSGMILLSISLLYDLTGHLLMENMYQSIQNLLETQQYLVPLEIALGLCIVGLAVKSALFPFSSWLPDAHGNATTASSAILSGIVLKGYIILLLKILMRVFGMPVIKLMRIDDILFFFGLLAMVMGSIYALRQRNIKRLIAYSSISQIGYIYMGIGLGTTAGITASCFHIIAHAATKPMLFTAAGALIDTCNHSKNLNDLRGSAYQNPLAGIGILVGSLSMIGMPFFAGFISKIQFATSSAVSQEKLWQTLLVLAISTILNAMYYLPMVIAIYTPNKELIRLKERTYHGSFTVAMLCFIIVNILLGTHQAPIIKVIEEGLKNF